MSDSIHTEQPKKENVDIEKREEDLKNFFKNSLIPKLKSVPSYVWVIISLILVVLYGFYIRILNIARLKFSGIFLKLEPTNMLVDHTTQKYIPMALDPFVILRYVKYVLENGALMVNDAMRYYPVGFNPKAEFTVITYFIAYLYKFINFFVPSATPELIHVLYPAIAFAIGLVFFFLTVKKIFDSKVALLSSLFLAVVPSFLYRTMSGFSDKESLSMMLMFMTFYFFISAWKSKKNLSSLILGSIAGLLTGINSLVWGGVTFIYFIFSLFVIICILLEKFDTSDLLAYSSWFLVTIYFAALTPLSRSNLSDMAVSATSGTMFFAFFLTLVYVLVFKKDMLKIKESVKKSLPSGLAAFLVTIVFVVIIASLFFGLDFIPGKVIDTIDSMISPLQNRWAKTVAESHEPYISDWFGSMGSVYVLMMFAAVILLFYDTFRPLKKLRVKATFVYTILLFLFIFSRYSSGSTYLNGVSWLSKRLYIGSLILFFLIAAIFYLYTFLKKKEIFENLKHLKKDYFFVFIWFIIMVMAARRAVRLIFVFSSISAVLVGYLLVRMYRACPNFDRYQKYSKFGFFSLLALVFLFAFDRIWLLLKYLWAVAFSGAALSLTSLTDSLFRAEGYFAAHFKASIVIAILLGLALSYFIKEIKEVKRDTWVLVLKIIIVFFTFWLVINLSSQTIAQAKGLGPSYHSQWQTAGDWVRENLDQDAVFAHWWDYGYWVQTGFERASVTDGGNAMGSWNHYMGRYLLTSPNDNETLEFLNTHEVSHILFVSDEVGKYPAFSSIGADNEYDRYSWINFLPLDISDPNNPKRVEDRSGRVYYEYIYMSRNADGSPSGFPLDDDFVYNDQVFPGGSAGIVGWKIPFVADESENGQRNIVGIDHQPTILLVYQGQLTEVPINCVFVGGRKIEFNNTNGLDGCLKILPNLNIRSLPGNSRFTSSDIVNVGSGMYLSPDVSKSLFARLYLLEEDNPNFNLVYSDHDSAPQAIYQGGRFHGPIRIWEVNYPKDTPKNPDYLDTGYIDPSVTEI